MDTRAIPVIKQKDAPSMKTNKSTWKRLKLAVRRFRNVWGIRTFVWLVFNTFDQEAIPGHLAYVTKITRMTYRPSRAQDTHLYAKELYNSGIEAIKESNDRIDKLLAMVLVALGWIASNEPVAKESLIFVSFSAFILFLARLKIEAFVPASFEDFTIEATQFGSTPEQTKAYEFNRACQYERAFQSNQFAVWLNHIRLFLASVCLVAGLVFFGLRF